MERPEATFLKWRWTFHDIPWVTHHVCMLHRTSSQQPRRTDSNLLADGTFPIVVGSCRIYNEDMKAAAHMDPLGLPQSGPSCLFQRSTRRRRRPLLFCHQFTATMLQRSKCSSSKWTIDITAHYPAKFNGYVGYVAKSATMMKHDETYKTMASPFADRCYQVVPFVMGERCGWISRLQGLILSVIIWLRKII